MISKEEIRRLQAGREIDVLVAEQVMGWQVETDEAKLQKLSGSTKGSSVGASTNCTYT